MPLVTRVIYEPDDLDRRMLDNGYVADIAAAEALGTTCRSLAGLERAGGDRAV